MPVPAGQEVDPAATRARILRTAERQFYARGVNAVGVSDVAAAANASKLSIYRHFGSKAGLVQAIASDRAERVRLWVRDSIASRPPGRERIAALFDLLTTWYAEDGFAGCGVVNAALDIRDAENADTSGAVVEILRRHLRGYVDVLRGNLEIEVARDDVDALARQLLILIEGATLLASVTGRAEVGSDAKHAAETLIRAAARA